MKSGPPFLVERKCLPMCSTVVSCGRMSKKSSKLHLRIKEPESTALQEASNVLRPEATANAIANEVIRAMFEEDDQALKDMRLRLATAGLLR